MLRGNIEHWKASQAAWQIQFREDQLVGNFMCVGEPGFSAA
jgi:hypothetical protein